MEIRYSATFKKQFRKLSPKIQEQFADRLTLWHTDPTNHLLRIHPLIGTFQGYWSMNISGDLRALYRYELDTLVIFALIGTHSQLYKK